MTDENTLDTATFGAGCFWGVQEEFDKIEGVVKSEAGYMGGHVSNPTYEDVCSDQTGHAEVVQIQFDPSKISYQKLLEVFFAIHDPTRINAQGPNVGSQYRSAIFFHSPEQEIQAREMKKKLDDTHRFHAPIATEIAQSSPFYKAEEYHQKYCLRRR